MIEEAVAQGVEETADLDWKRVIYDHQNPKWREEAAKDFAAMANSGGGCIVFGVAEDGERNAAKEITPVEWNASIEKRLLTAAYAHIGPPGPGPGVSPA
ncbi:helix-turn-helix domain-containing protein [uncultured Serinicoccus sp.]|uniref:AlbA family DNA-binding domain-containing protein n=1 Tax=uncultured Serinicoccus sp. TaxID=735514 RepID=UPI00260C8AB1|nr:ATP-binding protein [uncultured Serinicoccus sp.]